MKSLILFEKKSALHIPLSDTHRMHALQTCYSTYSLLVSLFLFCIPWNQLVELSVIPASCLRRADYKLLDPKLPHNTYAIDGVTMYYIYYVFR